MKLFYIGIFKNAEKPAHELVSAKDASTFSFWERSTVSEFMTFFSKTVAESKDAAPGKRQEIYEGPYKFHSLGHNTGIVGIIMSDHEYPLLVAQSLLNKVLDEFTAKYPRSTWSNSNPTLEFSELTQYLSKYQDPQQADNIMKIQKELDETKVILHKTIESVLERGEKIDDLVAKSQGLSDTSRMFYTKAKQQNSCCVLIGIFHQPLHLVKLGGSIAETLNFRSIIGDILESSPRETLLQHPETMALTGEEVAKHNSKESIWVIIHGKAYDVTEFAPEHPGGMGIILKYAGKDATEAYEPIHPPDTLDKYLDKSLHLGPVDMSTVAAVAQAIDPDEVARQDRIAHMPSLEQCYNMMDFESVARRVMKKTAWAYYSSGADDEITMRENHSAFHKIWFRPRILVDVEKVDFSTTMLGTKVDIPFYVTATALGKLGHPEGEVIFTKAAKKHNVIQMIPTLASCSFDQIVDAAEGDQVQWLQLYVNKDRAITKKIIQHAEKRGCKGLFITVDAPQLGRREKDMRSKFTEQGSDVQSTSGAVTDNSQGAARAISSFIDPSLSWKDIPWFQSVTKMPILLKGVQCVEDVLTAIEYGVQGVVISNHGGRQLDFARSGIEVLAEVMPILRERGLQDKIEIYIDGGVRRATDIIKAMCMGAKGVGIGRPFLFAMSAYGLAGVDKAMQLLKDEMEMNMRLIGCSSIDQLNPTLIDSRALNSHATGVPGDTLSVSSYDPLVSPANRAKAKL
ncbi:hypothetical protein O988_01028 [Pseudogymnoascus sp. VKM F-3808]|nr:hypothetical protein O988_01028 [Pseudogymnoascus sp. VKM F-3808]